MKRKLDKGLNDYGVRYVEDFKDRIENGDYYLQY